MSYVCESFCFVKNVKWTWNLFKYCWAKKPTRHVSSKPLLSVVVVPASVQSVVMERSERADFFTTFHELCAKLLTSHERSTLHRSLQIYQNTGDVTTLVSDTQFMWSSPSKLQLLPFVRHVIAVNDRQQFDALLGVHEGLVVRGLRSNKSSSMSSSKSGNRLIALVYDSSVHNYAQEYILTRINLLLSLLFAQFMLPYTNWQITRMTVCWLKFLKYCPGVTRKSW